MTFARLVLAASTNEPVPEPRTTTLPAEPTARALVQVYETIVLSLYPAFPGATLHALVSDIYQEHPRYIKSSEYWMFWMVLAIGAAAQSRSQLDEHYVNAVEFVGCALPHADRALKPGYVTQVQSLLLLSQYSMLDPAHFNSWHPIGFTCRAVVDQGLHQDPQQVQQMDQDALDTRRRTFYCVYALDRFVTELPILPLSPLTLQLSRAISMVQARAFSFYDDAVSVALPAPVQPGASALSSGSQNAKPSPDSSLPLFKLRQLQSDWYQTLYQGNPNEPLADATSFIWQKYYDMWDWSERLPTDMPAAIREMLDLELRYSYVYCIASSARGAQVSAYGRSLIFEHVISYIDRIHDIANQGTNPALYTYHDALRVFFMGSQFFSVLRDAGDLLLSGSPIPMPQTAPGKVSPPPQPVRLDRGPGDNLDRSLRCLERVKLTLRLYGERWEDALSLMEGFDTISAEVWTNLTNRRAMRNAAAAHHWQPAPGA